MTDPSNDEEFAAPDASAAPERLERAPDEDGAMNWRLVVGVLVTAGVLGYLVIDGLGSETYFFTVDEAVAQESELVGRTIRVKGDVVEGTIDNFDDRVGRSFEIAEKGKSLRVSYEGATPDTFKEGVQVVATGRLDESGTLHAEKILVKCPSRYGDKPPTAGGEGPQASR